MICDMANPVWLFHQDGNSNAAISAIIRNPRVAIQNCYEIEDRLMALQAANHEVGAYLELLTDLREFSVQASVSDSKNTDFKIKSNKTMIALLHQEIERTGGGVDESALEEIRALCNTIKWAINSDETLPGALKFYALQLVRHLEECIDRFDLAGSFDLQVAVERLNSCVTVAKAKTKRSDLWEKVTDQAIVRMVDAAFVGGALLMGAAFPSIGPQAVQILAPEVAVQQLDGTPQPAPEIVLPESDPIAGLEASPPQ